MCDINHKHYCFFCYIIFLKGDIKIKMSNAVSLSQEAYQLHFENFPSPPSYPNPNFKPSIAPPDEAFIKDPREKIETPLDSRGLVDFPSLIDGVRGYVEEDYHWRGQDNGHHLYWFDKLYTKPNLFNQDVTVSRLFRGLHLHIVELPRELHDFLHVVTLPVEVPDEEIMKYRIDSWNVAVSLFNHVDIIKKKKFLSNDEASQYVNRRILKLKFKSIEEDYDKIQKIPQEFRFFDILPLEKILGSDKVDHVKQKDLDRAKKAFFPVAHTKGKKAISQQDARRIALAA